MATFFVAGVCGGGRLGKRFPSLPPRQQFVVVLPCGSCSREVTLRRDCCQGLPRRLLRLYGLFVICAVHDLCVLNDAERLTHVPDVVGFHVWHEARLTLR